MAKRIEGLGQVQATFRGLPEAYQKSIARALGKAGRQTAETARALAPVDSGDLRDSIAFKFAAPKRGKGVAVVVGAGAGLDIPDRARWAEFGTAPHGDHPGTSAQPFMFPAYRIVGRKAKKSLRRAVKRAAKEEAQRRK